MRIHCAPPASNVGVYSVYCSGMSTPQRSVTRSVDDDCHAAAPAGPTQVRLSRGDLLERSGVDDELLTSLIKAGVITPIFKGAGTAFFDEHSVVIAQCARALADYGVEPRHLRAFRTAAQHELGLIEQALGPARRRRDAQGTMREIADGKDAVVPGTIEDSSVLDELRGILRP